MQTNNKLQCYTIGHSNHTIEKLLNLLKQHNINCIIDVRSNPYSRHNPQFNRENFKKVLKQHSIIYIDMGALLGARYTDPNLLFADGKVDFEKVRLQKEFKEGIKRVIDGIKKEYTISLMCSEKDPLNCHRFILVSYELHHQGVNVQHILEDGSIISNSDLEKKLIHKYKDFTMQIDLFEEKANAENPIEQAYIRRNKEIAYSNIN